VLGGNFARADWRGAIEKMLIFYSGKCWGATERNLFCRVKKREKVRYVFSS